VIPIVKLDGQPVGAGKPGPVAARLRELYDGYMDQGDQPTGPA
jgi:D-alanine transaminase